MGRDGWELRYDDMTESVWLRYRKPVLLTVLVEAWKVFRSGNYRGTPIMQIPYFCVAAPPTTQAY